MPSLTAYLASSEGSAAFPNMQAAAATATGVVVNNDTSLTNLNLAPGDLGPTTTSGAAGGMEDLSSGLSSIKIGKTGLTAEQPGAADDRKSGKHHSSLIYEFFCRFYASDVSAAHPRRLHVCGGHFQEEQPQQMRRKQLIFKEQLQLPQLQRDLCSAL